MTYRFLHVDTQLETLIKTAERTIDGQRRYYYAGAGPHRILIVIRNGEPVESLAGADVYVKALIGWDEGAADFVLPQHAGKRHTKITVDLRLVLTPEQAQEYAAANGIEIESLAHILANAPRSDRPGGARGDVGRKPVGSGTLARTITLTPEQWDLAERLGDSNASAGIRRALDAWKAANP